MQKQSLTEKLKDLRKNPLLAAGLIVMAVFVFLRIFRLHLPGETVFDEVYFPKMASQYLVGEKFFDIHPPLGKLIIAIGEWVFGNNTLGWRIMPLLFGLAILPICYFVMKQIFGDGGKRAGVITALLVAIDGLFIVYSRTGLMDIFMLLFGLVSVGFYWRFRFLRLKGETGWLLLFWTGLFAGLALAVKWIGLGFLPLVAVAAFITLYVHKERPFTFQDFLVWFGSFVLVPALVYTVPFIANMTNDPAWASGFWHEFSSWHSQAWNYNVNLEATHPYSSKWWSWPFLIRPIWFYYKNIEGSIVGVDGIGNPLVWWGSTLAIVYTVLVLVYSLITWRRKDTQVISRSEFWPLLFLLAGWWVFYLPWIGVDRVLFLYHYFGSYLFALLLAGFWLGKAMETKNSRLVTLAMLALGIVAGLIFAPIWIAYPISQAWFDKLMWFKSWI